MRVAIIGFGFSGAMVAANLVHAASAALTIYIIDEKLNARGVAYTTTNPDHLLNVRANNMSAFADAPEHFTQWLKHVGASLGAEDFAPRMVYGEYLEAIWLQTQEIAAQKKLEIKLVPSRAVALQTNAVLTERGDAIAVDKIVLAVGHEMKPILPQIKSANIIQNPWGTAALKDAAQWPSPVMLMGTGLTAVDMVLSLRRAGYVGEIIMASRNGRLPQPHQPQASIFSFTRDEIAAAKTLRQMLQLVRNKITSHGDWRTVVDALRSHMQRLWLRLTAHEQQRFLRMLLPIWNVHRHRMAPEIAVRVDAEIAAGTLRILGKKKLQVQQEGDALSATWGNEIFQPSRIINCTGLELNLAQSGNALLRQLVADGAVEPHVTGLGVAVDPQLRVWGTMHPQLYVIGSLVTGQLLESTAVPELRAQAASIAADIVA